MHQAVTVRAEKDKVVKFCLCPGMQGMNRLRTANFDIPLTEALMRRLEIKAVHFECQATCCSGRPTCA